MTTENQNDQPEQQPEVQYPREDIPTYEHLDQPVEPTEVREEIPSIEEAPPPIIERRGDSESVHQEFATVVKEPNFRDDDITLIIPGETEAVLEDVYAALPRNDKGDMISDPEWTNLVSGAWQHSPQDNFHATLSEDKKRKFVQVVRNRNNQPLGVHKPRINEADNTILRGNAALTRFRNHIGAGSSFRFPMWNSGFWITIQAPLDSDLIELDRQLSEEKTLLGSETRGLLYSNTSVFLIEKLVNFVIKHIESTTLKDSSPESILKKLVVHDVQHIAWAMACTIWPNGFQFARAILGRTPQENRVVKGRIKVSKLSWTDLSSLTEEQIRHMSNISANSMDDKSIETYQAGFAFRQDRVFEVEKTQVTLRVPNVAQHIQSGRDWVNNIVVMTDRVFGLDQDPLVRNQYIVNQGKATLLRQYGHWIKQIGMGSSHVEDEDTLMSMLSIWSATDASREEILNQVIKYAEDTVVSFIAVPTATEDEENQLPRAPQLLPIDALSTFFTLLRQKIPTITNR